MKRTNLLSVLVGAWLGGFAMTCSAGGTDVRVALVCGEPGDAVDKALALALPKLTVEKGVLLLDRQDIMRVLNERTLQLSGMLSSEQAISIGQILTVDLFAVVTANPDDKEPVGLVIFETDTGRRLWDGPLSADLEAAASAVVTGVRVAVGKHALPATEIKTLCLLPVRNAGLPRTLDGLCDTVGILLQRRLTRTPDVAVLERERLEHIITEQLLPGTHPLQDLPASVLRVDVDISRHPNGQGAVATAIVRDAAGKEVARAVAEQPATVNLDVADRLLDELLKELKAQPSVGTVDRVAEARQFGREARILREQMKPTAALRASQAAYAMDPLPRHKKELMLCQLGEGARLLNLEQADQAQISAALAMIRDAYTASYFGVDDWYALAKTKQRHPEHIAEIQEIEAILAEWNRVHDAQLTQLALKESRGVLGLTQRLAWYPNYSEPTFSKQNGEWSLIWLDGVTQFGTKAIVSVDYVNPHFQVNGVLRALLKMRSRAGCGTDKLTPDGQLRQLLVRQLEKMTGHPHPIVQIYGRLAVLQDQIASGTVSPDQQCRQYLDLREQIRQVAVKNAGDEECLVQEMAYMAGWDAIRILCNEPEWRFEELASLWKFMLEQKHLSCLIAAWIAPEMEKAVSRFSQKPEMRNVLAGLLPETLCLCDSPDLRETAGRMGAPIPDTASMPPWDQIKPLIESGKNSPLVRAPIIADDVAYTVRAVSSPGSANIEIQAIQVPLNGAPFAVFNRIPSGLDLSCPPEAMCLDNENLYLGTYTNGVVIFPRNGDPPRRLDTSNGLPLERVTGLAVLDGTLFIGQRPSVEREIKDATSHFIAYDLKTATFRVLASNTRHETRSPFDEQAFFTVEDLFADAPRNRVVFHLNVIAFGPGNNNQKLNGFWEYNLKTGQFAQLGDTPFCTYGFMPDARHIVRNTRYISMSLDLETSQLHLLRLVTSIMPTNHIPCPPDAMTFLVPHQSVYDSYEVVIGDSLWMSSPFCILTRDGRRQMLPNPFDRIKGILPLGKGERVLIASNTGIWILDLPPRMKTDSIRKE